MRCRSRVNSESGEGGLLQTCPPLDTCTFIAQHSRERTPPAPDGECGYLPECILLWKHWQAWAQL